MKTMAGLLGNRAFRIGVIVTATIVMFPAFFCVVSFLFAVTPAEAAARGDGTMPSDWEAGVLNHGQYYRWYTISGRPAFFAASLATLLVALGVQAAFFIKVLVKRKRA